MQGKEFGTFYFIIDVLKSGSEPGPIPNPDPEPYTRSASKYHRSRNRIRIRIRQHTPESMEPQIWINTDNG